MRDETFETFAEMYSEFVPTIVRYMRRRLGDNAAEDAAAEVFLRAFRKRASYDQASSSPLPWLFAIATNVISELRRSENRRLRAIERLAGQRAIDKSDDPADQLATDPRLIRALRHLSAPDRETVLLIAWGELTQEEAAIALGVPAGTVRSRLFRARRQLDDALQQTNNTAAFQSTAGETHA